MKRLEVLKEERRLFRLHQYQILDTEEEKSFSDLVNLAADICETPLAAISLVDQSRQWFKARVGFSLIETPREVSICNVAIQQSCLLEIEDVREDLRFSHFPFVKEAPGVRFYAAMPLLSSGGEAVGTLCVMDTVVRKLSEKQRLSLESLARQVVHLLEYRYQNRALEEAREESQKALKAKAEFLSVMSHELRTPLNGMLGMIHWLLEDTLRPDQQEIVSNLRFSAENLLSLINDILDYNKLNAQKLELEKVPFNLVETLQQLSRSFSFAAQQKGLSFKTTIYGNIPGVIGDPLRVTQVLTNLLGNAVKFTSEGEVVLEVGPVMETENYITLKFKVKDTGIGIAPEQQERIFEEFTQAGTNISRKYGGSGLGLSITRNLLQLMDSDIQVKSQLNKGSDFIFNLSFQKGQQKSASGKTLLKHTEKKFASKKILLTEDNGVNQLVALNFLSRLGVKADVAGNGVEAVKMAKQKQYDLILMDLHMPELDGFEATRQIRSLNNHYRNIPIIALSASAVLEVKQEAFSSGVSGFLMKPYNADTLYEALNEAFCKDDDRLPENYLQKNIDSIAGDDLVFKKDLTRLYLKSFREIMEALKSGKLEEIQSLRRIRHKHESTFQLLQLHDLIQAMAGLQKQIEDSKSQERAVRDSLQKIEGLCEKLIAELESLR